jgi:hypothetical protein
VGEKNISYHQDEIHIIVKLWEKQTSLISYEVRGFGSFIIIVKKWGGCENTDIIGRIHDWSQFS